MPNSNQRLSFGAVLSPYWQSREKWGAWGLLLLLISLLLIRTGLQVVFLIYAGELTSALAAQDAERFFQAVIIFLGILSVGVPAVSFSGYVRAKLGLFWRTWLTHYYLDQYLANNRFYQFRLHHTIHNPEQRIEEDVRILTQESLKFFVIFLESVFQLIGFAGVLWSVSQLLMVFLLAYSIIGTAIATVYFGKPLVGINEEQLRQEANFRYDLARIREHTEAIALYRGEAPELAQSWRRFSRVLQNFSRLIRWQFGLNLFQNHYRYATFVIPGVILAPRLFAGDLEIGEVTQAGAAFSLVLGGLGLIVLQFQQLTHLGASIQRLAQLTEACSQPLVAAHAPSKIVTRSGVVLAVANLTLKTPDSVKILVKDLSLAVPPQENLLIVGPSGVGKSSLLRAISGLWQSGDGAIIRPDSIAFLPQRPYLPPGSLRQQLLYPDLTLTVEDWRLAQILETVNLRHLLTQQSQLSPEELSYKLTQPLGPTLSLGEQQRLAFARILLRAPSYVILDEATSALDLDNEALLYRQLKNAAITAVSVGHRTSLKKYHHHHLELLGEGCWSYSFASVPSQNNGSDDGSR